MATCCLAFAAVGAASAQIPAIDQPCPIEWRGQPLSEALDQLSARVGVPWVRDASVTDQQLQTRVRLYAAHLNGRQAFRWTARSAGLEAVLTTHPAGSRPAMLVAAASRLPRSWTASGIAGGPTSSSTQVARWSSLQGQQADVEWIDLPITQIGREMATTFGVDAAVAPEIAAGADMVHLELPGASLETVLAELGRQLKASGRFEDGLIWFGTGTTSRPAGAVEGVAPGLTSPRLPLDRVVIQKPASFSELGRQLQVETGPRCRIQAAAGQVPPELQASGALADVLEALRLIEGWSWRHQQADDRKAGEVLISVPAPRGGRG